MHAKIYIPIQECVQQCSTLFPCYEEEMNVGHLFWKGDKADRKGNDTRGTEKNTEEG